jgi:hypothetical protein
MRLDGSVECRYVLRRSCLQPGLPLNPTTITVPVEHPMFAAIWVDYDDTETECK